MDRAQIFILLAREQGIDAAVLALPDPNDPAGARLRPWAVAVLSGCGFDCRLPGGAYFLYAPSPKGVAGGPSFDSAEAAAHYLITEHSVCTVPWDDAGAYLRFSVTYEAADEAAEDDLMAETESRLKKIQLAF